MRISGTAASLAGLEQALRNRDETLATMALRRLHLLYGVLCSIGGIPLIFLGEEWAVINDYSYRKTPEKADDSHWVHRPQADWDMFANEVEQPGTFRNQHFEGVRTLFAERKQQSALKGTTRQLLPGENPHVLAYLREHGSHRLAVLANFSERDQVVDLSGWRIQGLAHFFRDVFTARTFSTSGVTGLAPYELLWLVED